MSRRQADEEDGDSRVPLLTDHHHHGDSEDQAWGFSPTLSTMSTQSHEIKHVFHPATRLPLRDNCDTTPDYSHIHFRPRLATNDSVFFNRPPPPAYHRQDGSNGFPFIRNSQQGSFLGNAHRFRSQPQALSLEDVSGYDFPRRKSWSPPLLQQSLAGYPGQRSTRCYSSNMMDWEMGLQRDAPVYNPMSYSHDHSHAWLQGPTQSHLQSRSHFQNPQRNRLNSQSQDGELLVEASDIMPPRLAPVSGVLSENMGRNLIRPIAFKPASRQQCTAGCPHCSEGNAECGCQPTSTSARQLDPSFKTHSGPSLSSQWSIHAPGCASYRHSKEPADGGEDYSAVVVRNSPRGCAGNGMGAGVEGMVQTPSPSDSGVGELEAMLKEREAEILTLRQVMDRNERAIFQVYEEKKSQWLQDMHQIKEDYELKLKIQQQKAGRLEQTLASQVRRLQQEKQQLRTNLSKDTNSEKGMADSQASLAQTPQSPVSHDSSDHTPHKNSATHGEPPVHNDDEATAVDSAVLEEEIEMKNREILALRSQMQTLEVELEAKDAEIAHNQQEVRSKEQELQSAHDQLDQLSAVDGPSLCEQGTQTSPMGDMEGGVSCAVLASEEEYTRSLERQVDSLREQLQSAEGMVETERLQWLEEKNKVIRYQKQLQLNYIQMQRKNTTLEAEIEQLTVELESRHLKLAALNGEESVC